MEVVDEGWVQDIILVRPGSFLRAVPLPIYEVLKPTAPPSGVEDFLDDVDGFGGSDLGWRGGNSCSVDGGRRGLVKGLSRETWKVGEIRYWFGRWREVRGAACWL